MIRLFIKKGLLGESGTESFPVEHRAGLTVRSIADAFREHLPASVDLEVAVNGRHVPPEQIDEDLPDGCDVMVMPVTGAGLDLVALLVYALVMAAVSFAINYLMSSLSPRPKPPGVPQERGDESSATYAWDGIQTNFGQGFPVPWVYGTHAVGGQVIYTDVFATTAGGTIDDRLRIILALCEGPIHAIGNTVATELDGLGGVSGGVPGAALPSDIRVNNNVLASTATAEPVTNVLTGTWSPAATFDAGQTLTVKNSGGAAVGSVQVIEVRNAQRTDLDVLLLSGTIAVGNTLTDIGSFAPQPVATITVATTVQRLNTTPGARAWIRPGTLDQSPLPSNPFRGTSVTFSPQAQLNEANEESIYTYSLNDEITTVGFVIAFPGGLYSIDPQGNLQAYPVRFDFSWRPVGTTSWRLFYQPQGGGQPLRSRTIGGANPRVGPLLDSWGADLAPPGSPAERGPIEVRMIRRSPGGGTDSVTQAIWRNVFFNTAHVLAYPRVALLGLELAAGARFNGGLPNCHVKISGLKVRTWSATHGFSPRTFAKFTSGNWAFSYHDPGRNPAWVLLDFLTSPWGLGKFVKDADLDLPSFRRWAAFCDMDPSPADPWNEPAFRCDLVGDTPRPAWEWVLAICAAGRASPVVRNGKIGVVYQYRDEHFDSGINGIAVAAKSPVQLITSGNCEKVNVTWLPKSNRPTAFLFQFLNETNLYAQDVLPVEDSEGTLNDPASLRKEEWRPETIQAYGVTRPSQVFREGVWRHRVQRLIRRELAFVTGRWALAAEVGDLIEFEHELLRPFGADVPLNMVVSIGGTGVNTVKVDHDVVGATQIIIRDRDGKPQRRTITGLVPVDPTGTDVTFSGAAVNVDAGATCVVGLVDKLTETYEIVSITLQKDLKREVRAVQWVPAVHDPITPAMFSAGGIEGGVDGPEGMLDQPPQEGEPQIEFLRVVPDRDGSHLIVFAKPMNRRSNTVRVYVRDIGFDAWITAGETTTEELRWPHFVPGRSYEVAVCLEGVAGQHALPDDAPSIEFVADEFPPFSPPRVTNARAAVLDEFLLIEWDDLDTRDLLHYEVRIGSDWTSGQVVYRERAPRALLGNPPGGGTALIAARSRSGLYGIPVAVALPAWSPRNTASVVSDDDLAPSPAGTHSNTQFTGGYITLASGALSGTYTSAEQDVGYQAPVFWQVKVDRVEIENVTVDELTFAVDSGEARWRTVNGRPASPAHPGVDWQTRVDDLTMTIDDVPHDLRVHGHVGEPGSHTRVLVESRFEVGGVWSAWKQHNDRTVVARKMQVRLTLNRESVRYETRVTGLSYAGFL